MACLTRPSYATSRAPRLDLGIRNNTIICSGIKIYFKFPSQYFTFSKPPVSSISVSAVNFLAQVEMALHPGPQSNFFACHETCHAKLLVSFIVERYLNVPAHKNSPSFWLLCLKGFVSKLNMSDSHNRLFRINRSNFTCTSCRICTL